MSRTFTALGASTIVLAILTSGVDARSVFYEVNGQRYSYDTSNRRQTAAARKVIEAAKAAETAKAKAMAERASNPLVAVFGSRVQREVEAAQAQLNRIISEQEQAAAANESQWALAATKKDHPAQTGDGKAEGSTRLTEGQKAAAVGAPTAQPGITNLPVSIEAAQLKEISKAAIKSVFLDAATGIKTIVRGDGSIHEELFDPDILSKLNPRPESVADGAPDTGQLASDEVTRSTSFREKTLGVSSSPAMRGEPLPN